MTLNSKSQLIVALLVGLGPAACFGGLGQESVPSYQSPPAPEVFPHKVARPGQDKKPLTEPVKGWVPRGWDDGIGYDHSNGKSFASMQFAYADESTIEKKDGRLLQAYGTPSNHLAQDIADMLLNIHLSTRDPAVAEAMACLYRYRNEYFGEIPVLRFAYDFICGKDLTASFAPWKTQVREGMLFRGMYLRAQTTLGCAYDDSLAWQYRQAAALASQTGELSPDFAWYVASVVHDVATAMEMYFDDAPWPYGMYFFDIQAPPVFVQATGKLDRYASAGKLLFGARGIQFSAVGAAVLPAIRKHPDVWEKPYKNRHGSEPLVRIVDTPPTIDGKREAAYDKSASIVAASCRVNLISDPKNLYMYVESSLPAVTIDIRQAEGFKCGAVVHITSQGKVTVRNDRGRELLHGSAFSASDPLRVELTIPYTIVPAQKSWINGVEHGRYVVSINGSETATVYFLSEPQRIVRRVEQLALGTVGTWHETWDDIGCVPSAWRTHNLTVRQWEVSDAGNYAHLIKAIAFILMDRASTAEWNLISEQMPKEHVEAGPLPESVLRALSVRADEVVRP